MAKQNAQTEQQKHDLLVLLTECEDRAYAEDARQALRKARRRLEESAPDAARLAELTRAADETRTALKEDRAATLHICLSELEALMDAPTAEAAPQPGFLARLLRRLFGKKADPQDELMQKHESEAEQNVFALEKRIAALIDQRAEKLGALRRMKADCDAAPAGSSEAGILQRQMRMLAPQIRDLDRQIAQSDKLLMSNARYQAQLAAGRATFELRQFIPDTAEAEVLLGAIEAGTREIAENQRTMDALLEKHDAAVQGELDALSGPADAEAAREFDLATEHAAEEAAKAAVPATAQAQDANPAEEIELE